MLATTNYGQQICLRGERMAVGHEEEANYCTMTTDGVLIFIYSTASARMAVLPVAGEGVAMSRVVAAAAHRGVLHGGRRKVFGRAT